MPLPPIPGKETALHRLPPATIQVEALVACALGALPAQELRVQLDLHEDQLAVVCDAELASRLFAALLAWSAARSARSADLWIQAYRAQTGVEISISAMPTEAETAIGGNARQAREDPQWEVLAAAYAAQNWPLEQFTLFGHGPSLRCTLPAAN